MPLPTTSLSNRVDPEAAKLAGAGPLLYGWARRTKFGKESTERHIDALLDVEKNSELYKALGAEDMESWALSHKSHTPYTIQILGLPYGGPNDGKDNDGQWFSAQTDFMDGVIEHPALMFLHGTTNNFTPETVGTIIKRWYDRSGGWFEAELDPNSSYFDQIVSAHKSNNLRASSGVVPASFDYDKSTGHINTWLVGEVSLVDLREGYVPSNGYAITKAEVVFDDYYGDQVIEGKQTMSNKIAELLDDLRLAISELFASKAEEVEEKCEMCDKEAEEEATKLKAELAEMAMSVPEDKCANCVKAIQWVRTMVKANKISVPEALDLVNKFEKSDAGWETIKEDVESRPNVVEAAISKAKQAGVVVSVAGGNIGNQQDTVDPEFMNRMRTLSGLPNK